MKKLTRALAMSGVAVAAGVTMAAGPAAASTGSAASQSGPSADTAKSAAKTDARPRRERIYDYYRSPRTCHKVGRSGVWEDRWERYSCFPVNGFHRGGWALKVYYGWGGGHGHGGPGGHGPHGHGGPGGPGGPGGFDGPGGWKKN
ncbi:hypothetical protein FB565_007229 [Actinoplanes lutulentus]|uniref:Uncharacterized protein n=1 Tax=Actinoplanes lutulentus TaxID=1287878 RepID=A0A327Z477_9ACTN|nr:hypothetical protein [Actinoplanes lutulentus]MBB2947458.1 hypothetical protein [Actinoplanes lutulentus]RAK28065.1 hypothetical protein B0I29_121161 [Actinoplanes lutulentus]